MYGCHQFLDTQRIDNLTVYLEALHKAQMASEDHTTLLLNCYTKRKDVSKLDEFIKVTIVLIGCKLLIVCSYFSTNTVACEMTLPVRRYCCANTVACETTK